MKLFLLAALVAVAAAAPSDPYAPRPRYGHQEHEHRPYQYDYAVNDHYSGAVFSQNENSDANNVNGYYSVNMPDGRVQHVKYVADHDGYGGYNAEVTYEGEARYDEYKPSYKQPAYKPTPSYQPRYN